MRAVAELLDQLLEWVCQCRCLGANIDSSFHSWAVFSIKNKDEVNWELVEVCYVIKKIVKLKVFANLVMHAWDMEYYLHLV